MEEKTKIQFEESSALDEFKKELLRDEFTLLNWQITRSDKLLKMNLPTSDFLIENLIPKNGITILAGTPSSGKSWFLLEVAKCVASNKKLFEKFETTEARVLVLDEEVPLTETKRRWEMLDPEILTLVDFMNLESFKICDENQRKALLEICYNRGYTLIIFDSLRDIHTYNENDSSDAQKLMDFLKEFCKRGITVLLSHHYKKESYLSSNTPSQLLRGSTALLANLDCLLAIDNIKRHENLLEFVITQPKLRQNKPYPPFKISLNEVDKKMLFQFLGDIEEDASKIERAKDTIANLLTQGEKFQTELINMLIPLGFSEATIRRALEEMKETKHLNIRVGEKKRHYLSLKSS